MTAAGARTLTQRMFTAANIIDGVRTEFARRAGLSSRDEAPEEWSAYDLRTQADQWDRDDAAAVSEAAAIEELARELHLARIVSGQINGVRDYDEITELDRERRRSEARQLIISGYRRGGA